MMIVDDHAANQTLAVFIKKPISVVCIFCRRALNEFTEVASRARVNISGTHRKCIAHVRMGVKLPA